MFSVCTVLCTLSIVIKVRILNQYLKLKLLATVTGIMLLPRKLYSCTRNFSSQLCFNYKIVNNRLLYYSGCSASKNEGLNKRSKIVINHNFHRSYFSESVTWHSSVLKFWDKLALVDSNGSYTYGNLFTKSFQLQSLLKQVFEGEEAQQKVAILLPNDVTYVIAQWMVFASGHVLVPLHPSHPDKLKKYFMDDSKASLIITNEEYSEKMKSFLSGQQVVVLEKNFLLSVDSEKEIKNCKQFCAKSTQTTNVSKEDVNALVVYTSGTTGRPKGVVLTQRNLQNQVECLVKSWKMSSSDVFLHCLPLNHIHGIVNALMCPLYCGGSVVMEPAFDASSIWGRLLNLSGPVASRVNVFMAVPTIYAKLIQEYEAKLSSNTQMIKFVKKNCLENIRLMVSGSASLPTPIFENWQKITGHTLLERYGMTEIGMALSNPINGTRKPGFVGLPLPGVQVQIVEFNSDGKTYNLICEGDEHRTNVTEGCQNKSGELLIKSPSVFGEYLNREEETKKQFTDDGWFRTGDTAAYVDGSYKILGRTSVDIIKSGGFKISALDVERHLLSHLNIKDVAVVGLPDETWGEKVGAAIVWDGEIDFDLQEFRNWAKEVLPSYQVPTIVKVVPHQLPRNTMGKINKKTLIKNVFSDNS